MDNFLKRESKMEEARVPNAALWWSLAVVHINPAWSPMKALPVQCAGSCVELEQAPLKGLFL